MRAGLFAELGGGFSGQTGLGQAGGVRKWLAPHTHFRDVRISYLHVVSFLFFSLLLATSKPFWKLERFEILSAACSDQS